MPLEIRLLPDDPEHLEESKKTVLARTSDFVVRILNRAALVPSERYCGIDQRQASLASDLLATRFWGALTWIDGRAFNYENDRNLEERTQKNKEARAWSAKTFAPHELHELLNLIINQALLKPYSTSWPGTARGHSILYRELVEKEDSIYAAAVTAQFHHRLINGRFWEELAHDDRITQDTLENHYGELDTGFAVSRGLNILRSNPNNLAALEFKFRFLNEPALDKYAQFLHQLDQQEGCTQTVIEALLQPYLARALAWDGEMEAPYYHGGTDLECQVRGRFQDKLHCRIVQKYAFRSPDIQIYLAAHLGKVITEYPHSMPQTSGFVKSVLETLPNPKEIMKLMLPQLRTETGIRFFQESEQQGHSLYGFMS